MVAEDRLFLRHRICFGRELLKSGHEIGLACEDLGERSKIETTGIKVFDVPFSRSSLSPFSIFCAVMALRKIIWEFKPDLLHAVAIRPILITALARSGSNVPLINAITGMGSLFSGELTGFKFWLTRRIVSRWLKFAFHAPGAWTVFQNQEDMQTLVESGVSPRERTSLIRGAGVEVQKWIVRPEPDSQRPIVLFISRLLRDKGIRELVEASQLLVADGIEHELRIAGDRDPANPNSIDTELIEKWEKLPQVRLLGWRDDVLEQMSQANIIVLPSYREGLPKTLLEAGAAQRAVVTCDVIGCRELITDGKNGLLVPARNSKALADALRVLIQDRVLRSELAMALRKEVETNYSLSALVMQFQELYKRALSNGSPS